jgi:hypothetical protein
MKLRGSAGEVTNQSVVMLHRSQRQSSGWCYHRNEDDYAVQDMQAHAAEHTMGNNYTLRASQYQNKSAE